MNDLRFTASIRRALDESAARLPPRVTQRLEAARAAALAQTTGPAARRDTRARFGARPGARPDSRIRPRSGPGYGRRAGWLLGRLAFGVAPLAVLVGGLFAIDEIESRRHAVEIAEVEAAVLTDIVPIAAYVDRGFGVYLKNSRQ